MPQLTGGNLDDIYISQLEKGPKVPTNCAYKLIRWFYRESSIDSHI